MCVAGGSGLAPFWRSSKRQLPRYKAAGPSLFRARAQRDLYARGEVAALREAWGEVLTVHEVLSEEPADAAGAEPEVFVSEALAELPAHLGPAFTTLTPTFVAPRRWSTPPWRS